MSKYNFLNKKFGRTKKNDYFCGVITKQRFMKKRNLLILACIALLAVAAPMKASNMVMEMGVAEQVEELTPAINVEGNMVNVQNAAGMTLEIVSLTGRAVANYKIEGPAQRIELNLPKGCYILKVGKVVRKVTVR